jgi:hypothetical protein
MNGVDTDQNRMFLTTALATPGQKRVAIVIAVLTALLFVAAIPVVRMPLAQMPVFIPSYEAALFFIDLVTAVLLYDQFARLRSLGILVLASAYLFDALIIVPHALTFPGAFSPTGLLGAREQTTGWLYVFWHGGFPLFVMAYALLHRRELPEPGVERPGAAIVTSVITVAVLTLTLTLLTTWGHDYLPVIVQNGNYALLVSKGVSPAVWILTFIAMLLLWQRKQRVVDLWLMLVMWVWLFDIALSAVISSKRFDLGYYGGRIFGLIAASFLLITLIVEMAKMYSGAMSAAQSAEERLARLRSSLNTRQSRSERTEHFIQRQNIVHYRTLLESGTLDPAQRRSIENLLAEEEKRQSGGGQASA